MNKLFRIFIGSLALLTAAVSSQAQPAVKLLVIDMAKALEGHYKTEEINSKFQAEAQKVEEQLGEMSKQIQKTRDEANELIEQSRNTVLKEEVRKQAEVDAQKKIQEFQQLQNDAQEYRGKNQQSFQQRAKNSRELLFEEISNVARDIARARGATLVLDKSGPTLIGVPAIVYADAAYDITDDVLKEVNKNRPAPAPKPAAPALSPAPATATPTAPAAPSTSAAPVPNKP
jgi:outer membrane protein